jgi:hypothetical protein
MTGHDRGLLDAATTWPVRLVTDGSGICGFLMPLLGKDFMATVSTPSGATVSRPRTAQWLVVNDTKAGAVGVETPSVGDIPTRLLLCARVAHTLGVLHRHGLTFGDLSYNNVVYSLDGGRPSTRLVDCDGVRAVDAAIGQEQTPDWWPPENVDGTLRPDNQDAATDRYKLALFILRVLTAGELASVATDPIRAANVLDETGLRMLADGLGADRAARPTARQWFVQLVDYAVALTSPPELTHLAVTPMAVLAGQEVQLRWRTRAADRLEIRSPDGRLHPVPVGVDELTVPVHAPGAHTVTAVNSHGATSARSGHVFVVSPPAIDRIRLPEPALPTADAATDRLAGQLSGLMRAARFDPPAPLPDVMVDLPEPPMSTGAARDALTGTTVVDWMRASAPRAADLLAVLTPHLPGNLTSTGPAPEGGL